MSPAAVRQAAGPYRNALIAKVHLGAKDLRMDDTTRRDVLEAVTGQRSAADCTDIQLAAVLEHYRSRGWRPSVISGGKAGKPQPRKSAPAMHPLARKARAMWISLHQLGAIHDRSDKALEAFARRQLGCEVFAWADQRQGYKLVEALKAMAERAGWSQAGTLDDIKDRLKALLEVRGGA